MSQATRLDRANWAKIQFGNGAPSANTKGNIYINRTASTGGLYFKRFSNWIHAGGLTATSPSIEDGLAKFSNVSATNLETCLFRERQVTGGDPWSTTLQVTDARDQSTAWVDVVSFSTTSDGESGYINSMYIGDTDQALGIKTSDAGTFNLYDSSGGPYAILNEGMDDDWEIPDGTITSTQDYTSSLNLKSEGTYTATIGIKVGTRHPTTGVNGNYGDIYVTKDGASSDIYLKIGAGSTSWSSLLDWNWDPPMAVFQDEKLNAAAGGSSAETYHTRDLNDTVRNNITGCSLATNQITLPAGQWLVEVWAPHYNASGADSVHFIEFYNVTDVSAEFRGQNHICPTGQEQMAHAIGVAAAGDVYEVRHWIGKTQASNGLGRRTDNLQNRPGSYNRYTLVKITQLQ